MKNWHGPDWAAFRFFAKYNPPRRHSARRAAPGHRRLLLEPLETRRLLAPLAELWYEFDPLSGSRTTPPAQTAGPVVAGQKYMLNAYIQDNRGTAATGLEAAYINLSYDASLISLVGSVNPDDFSNAQERGPLHRFDLPGGRIHQQHESHGSGGGHAFLLGRDPGCRKPDRHATTRPGDKPRTSNLPIVFLPPGDRYRFQHQPTWGQ